MRKLFSLLAAVLFAGSMMADSYVKVTTAPTDWAGDYLLVYEAGNVAFNSALETFDAVENTIAVTITDGAIAATETTNAAKITIAAVEGGYSVQGASGKYLGATSYANSLATSETAIVNALSVADGVAAMTVTTSGGDVTMKFNAASNQMRFRYYKSGQQDVALYKLSEGGTTPDPEPEPEPVVTANVDTVYDWAYAIGSTLLGGNSNISIATVKIHTNTDDVNCLKFGSSYVYADGKWVAIKPAEGAFKAGDTLKVAAVFNNSDDTKYAQVDLRAADGDTRIWLSDSASTINSRTSAADPIVQNYVLEADADSLFLGRYGNTGMCVTFLQVVRAKSGDEPVVITDPTNCAEAAAAALSVADNNVYYNDSAVYTIEGYVTAIQTAYSSTYNNISFWMADAADGGKVLEAFRAVCATADDAPAVGDKVAVTGALTKYNSTPEFGAGCTYVIKEKAPVVEPKNLGEKTIAEFLALKNTVDTCVLTGIVYNIYNTTYGNLYLTEGTDTLSIYGVLTPEGEAKQFENLNVAEGDTLTVKAVYGEYNNKPQAKNAVFVAVKKAPVEPGDTIDITISSITTPGAVIWTDYVAEEGWWQIQAQNDNYYVTLSNGNTITAAAGTYTVADLDADYSFIEIMTETDTTDVAFADGSVTVAIDEAGVVTVVGALLAEDGNTYNFNLTYVEPKAETTVNVTISEGTYYGDYADYGLYGVYGYSDDNTAYVQLGIWADAFQGNFTEEDLDFQYFGSIVVDAAGQQTIYTAAIEVIPADAEGEYLIKADLLCYNNTLYKVTITISAEQGIDAVEAAKKAVKKLVNGMLVIEKAGKAYNANGVVIR